MAPDADAMTPAQAAQILRDVEGYEETLSLHTAGLTHMVWGVAVAGIFLMYGSAMDWLQQVGAAWAAAVLWVPFVVAGLWITRSLWHSHAVHFGEDPDPRDMVWSALATVGFLGGSVLLWLFLDGLAPLRWLPPTAMLFATGVFAIVMGVFFRNRSRFACNTLAIAGVSTALGAIALAATDWSIVIQNLVSAIGGGLTWFVPGHVLYQRG